MTINVDALFAGMKTAQIFGRGNYMGPGLYEVELQSVKAIPRRAGGNVFIAEFTVLSSNNPAHAPGSTGSWCPKIELDNTFGDIKCLMFSCMGLDPKTVQATDVDAHEEATLMARAACGSESARDELAAFYTAREVPTTRDAIVATELVKGIKLRLECTQITTRAGKPFTRYTWSPLAQ